MTQYNVAHVDGQLGACWDWQGSRTHDGYGKLGHRYMHRVLYEMAFGPIPEGLLVCHHCDNPPCVRPDHLFLGTNSDNQLDASAKGINGQWTHPERTVRGERQHKARLTSDQVREIRNTYRPGRGGPTNLQRFADRFGVDRRTIHRVVLHQTWTHLP